ncbi:hypothetical protein [Alkalinema sp. FACHB-956]|uniref:hypothetical protein n=1 Tax=Alkalinema sp. FACHB-956 TaxID=2692768 RepID=UPI0016897088|nr:hypothetical protein [Alkalinema sp. FACHB-956]MBD2329372.1 hypothetical protein [Alkalinema sp. FACHB-956]
MASPTSQMLCKKQFIIHRNSSIVSMLKKLNWLAPALSIALFTGVGSAIVDMAIAQPSVAQAKPAKQSIWKTFSPAGGGFSILMPGTPKKSSHLVKTQTGATIELIGYVVDLGPSKGGYLVLYSDMPLSGNEDSNQIQQILDNVMNGGLSRVPGELVSYQTFALNGYPGREVTFRIDGNITGKVRMFLVGNRLYQLLAFTTQEKATAKSVNGFFNSFKLVNNLFQ